MFPNIKVVDLRCEYCHEALGISEQQPRLSYRLKASGPFSQSAVQILVASSLKGLAQNTGDFWNSGKLRTSQTSALVYRGRPLYPTKRYFWKVRVWGKDDSVSAWSAPSWFETGFFSIKDWNACWIAGEAHQAGGAVYCERTEFDIPDASEISRARLYAGSTGGRSNSYELRLNGCKVGEDVIRPGQLNEMHALYRTYDVAPVLLTGCNALGVMHTRYIIIQLDVVYLNGRTLRIATGSGWKQLKKGGYSELRFGLRGLGEGKGESFDASNHPVAWDRPGFDDSRWITLKMPFTRWMGPRHLKAQLQPITAVEEFNPIRILKKERGTYFVDFGQNLHGTLSVGVKGKKGRKITIRYAEKEGAAGNLDTEGIETSWLANVQPQYDEFKLAGRGWEIFENRFSSHGFRFVEIQGYPGKLLPQSIKSKAVYSKIVNDSFFKCPDTLITQLHHCAVWAFKSNLVSVPTDCPTRERNGWMGDAHCHAEADCYNFDMALFYDKWFDDIRQVQCADGHIPFIVPVDAGETALDVPWMAAIIIIPWLHYQWYADRFFLEKNYSMMGRWLDSVACYIGKDGLVKDGLLFGDWTGKTATLSPEFLSSAYFVRCLDLMADLSGMLGRKQDAQRFLRLGRTIKQAIIRRFFHEQTFFDDDSQTANVLAVAFHLVPENKKIALVKRLAKSIQSTSEISAGCLGAAELLEVLSEHGEQETAWALVKSKRKRTWGNWIREYHATTALESLANNKSSNNHAFLAGGLDTWFYKHLAGISALKPGFEEIRIKPYIPPELDQVSAQVDTIRGLVKSSWKKTDDEIRFLVEIPANTTAFFYLCLYEASPASKPKPLEIQNGNAKIIRRQGNEVILKLLSGEHVFVKK